MLQCNGPLLLACNHPNSFLDGIILTTLFDKPVYSLARGDAFNKRWTDKLLRRLQLLPVYRTSEGVENLGHNYTTFDTCRRTFEENGIVLIFSEGRCENEWHLRPLRKGTARLAVTSWKKGIPLQVIPTALNYSSFGRIGKEVHIFFGEAIDNAAVMAEETEGKRFLHFNDQLNSQLRQYVYEINPADKKTIGKIFSIKPKLSLFLLFIPAMIGWVAHAPLFYSCKLAATKMKKTGHYDSVVHSLLLVAYPAYLLVILLLCYPFLSLYILFLLILMPFTAWACIQAKYQMDL